MSVLQFGSTPTQGQVITGQLSPRQGWYSERYEAEQPAPVLVSTAQADQAVLATLFVMGERVNETAQASLSFSSPADLQLTLDIGAERVAVAVSSWMSNTGSVVVTRAPVE